MKKIYMKPTTKVVVLNHRQHLLAGSNITLGAAGSADEAEAHGFNDFDDFDE